MSTHAVITKTTAAAFLQLMSKENPHVPVMIHAAAVILKLVKRVPAKTQPKPQKSHWQFPAMPATVFIMRTGSAMLTTSTSPVSVQQMQVRQSVRPLSVNNADGIIS